MVNTDFFGDSLGDIKNIQQEIIDIECEIEHKELLLQEQIKRKRHLERAILSCIDTNSLAAINYQSDLENIDKQIKQLKDEIQQQKNDKEKLTDSLAVLKERLAWQDFEVLCRIKGYDYFKFKDDQEIYTGERMNCMFKKLIQITFYEKGKGNSQDYSAASGFNLGEFRQYAQTVLNLPDNPPCQLLLERTGEVLKESQTFTEAGIKSGDKLILIRPSVAPFSKDKPRQTLCELIERYGKELCDEPRRFEGMLRDICGKYHWEISALVGALDEGVVADLLTVGGGVEPKLLLGRLAQRLQNKRAIAPDAAVWAVESWALALGLIEGEGPVVLPEPEHPSEVPNGTDTTRYTLHLTLGGTTGKVWDYSIELLDFYEDNPEQFFTNSDGWERQKFEVALGKELGRKVRDTQFHKILHSWCQQISLGYREAYLYF